MNSALIFGIGGQDGSYLADILVEKGYRVYGTSRRSSIDNLTRIKHLTKDIENLYRVDLTDSLSVYRAINDCKPDVIFNEADQDNVGWSYDIPKYSIDVTVGGVSNILESVKQLGLNSRIFIPTSATIFGDISPKQCETDVHKPLHPYACAKLHAYHLARYYRIVHNMHVSTGILYNHDSPRRSKEYLLQHVFRSVQDINRGIQKKIKIGCLEMKVDIGYAREFMEGVVRLMEYGFATDMIFATSKGYTIREVVESYLYRAVDDTHDRIETDSNFSYPGPQVNLIGDISYAKAVLGWEPKYDALSMYDVLMKGV